MHMNEPDYKEHIKIINGLSNAVMKENQSMQVSHWSNILGYFELVSISNRQNFYFESREKHENITDF